VKPQNLRALLEDIAPKVTHERCDGCASVHRPTSGLPSPRRAPGT